ncbi:MAG: calcium/sodium antiporter [Flavobacteriales bacterium]|nr:MAG: calcium/sodium antiporter [Flavobacteriales bacterium]
MILEVIFLVLGLVLLVVGSDLLLRSSIDLSLKYNVSKLVIGLTIVSFATSAPELLISISSVLKNSSDIAISNVIGSNIANIGLVFSIALLFVTINIKKENIKYDFPWLIIVSLLFIWFLQDSQIDRFEGVVFTSVLVLFIIFSFKVRANESEDLDDLSTSNMSLSKIFIYLALSSILLYSGSELFVESSIFFANYFGVSERVIGLTMVAMGTSLPELATTLVAIYKKELDISIGNIIGSNIFNILAVIGITSIIRTLSIKSSEILSFDIYVMFAFSAVLGVFFFFPRKYKMYSIHGLFLLSAFFLYYFTLL